MYVNNKKLYEDIADWLKRRESDPMARMGEYTAQAILLVANNLVKRYNFSNYTWREEMVGDGVECCVKYLKNYNLKFTNPHAYLTTVCYSAFVNRIKKENHQNHIKYKIYINEVVDIEEFDDDGNQIHVDYSFYRNIGEKLKEQKPKEKAEALDEPKPEVGLEAFLE